MLSPPGAHVFHSTVLPLLERSANIPPPTINSPAVRAARSNIARLSALVALVSLADFVFGAVYVDVLLKAGMTPGLIGLGFFLAFAVSTAVEVPSGDWGDRWGQRRIAVIGLACWGISLVVFALALGIPWAMLVALCAWSVGQALYSGAPISLTINQIPSEQRELRASAARVPNIAKWGGSAAGSLAVFLGVIAVDVQMLIGASGGVLILLAGWMLWSWKESERHEPEAVERHMLRRLRGAWTPGLGRLLVMAVLASVLLSVVIFSWQPLVATTAGLPVSANGLILFAMTAFAALGAWLSRYSSRIPGNAVDVPLALLVVSVAVWVAGCLPGAMTTFMSLGIGELFISYCLTVLAVGAHELFNDDFRNLLWSLFSASMGMAMAIADLLFALLWSAAGMQLALVVVGITSALILLAALLWIALIQRTRGPSGMASQESSRPM